MKRGREGIPKAKQALSQSKNPQTWQNVSKQSKYSKNLKFKQHREADAHGFDSFYTFLLTECILKNIFEMQLPTFIADGGVHSL